jgi:hypothetical protein
MVKQFKEGQSQDMKAQAIKFIRGRDMWADPP